MMLITLSDFTHGHELIYEISKSHFISLQIYFEGVVLSRKLIYLVEKSHHRDVYVMVEVLNICHHNNSLKVTVYDNNKCMKFIFYIVKAQRRSLHMMRT